ncbi:hypothetical protein P0F65_05235 [Sphingomonas sp. I4]
MEWLSPVEIFAAVVGLIATAGIVVKVIGILPRKADNHMKQYDREKEKKSIERLPMNDIPYERFQQALGDIIIKWAVAEEHFRQLLTEVAGLEPLEGEIIFERMAATKQGKR